MELAGTGQMWAVPDTAASIHCCLAAPAVLSLAGQEGLLWDVWGAVPGGVWGREGEHPQVRCGEAGGVFGISFREE